jgi:hypothetical protein
MDKNENLRDLRAELAGSRLTRPERTRAQAQASDIKAELAESQPTPAKAADAEPHAASSPPASTSQLGQVTPGEASSQRTTKERPGTTDPTVEAAVSALENRPNAPTAPPPAATATTPNTGPVPETKDPLRDLVNHLAALASKIEGSDPRLAKDIQRLVESLKNGKDTAREQFQTRVAYALQDAERILGPLPNVSQGLRDQMTLLATTQRGLHNEPLQQLLRDTPHIADTALVRLIRETAGTVARERDQHSTPIVNRVGGLIERARHAPRTGALDHPSGHPSPTEGQIAPTPAGVTPSAQAAPNRHTNPALPQSADRPPQPVLVTSQASGPGALVSIFRALRDPNAPAREPWDSPLTPLGPRIGPFEAKLDARANERQLAEAERAARTAQDALRQFSQGPGASVLNKIRDAARAEPEGFHGVMTEMREGGKYADLRKQFNTALATERGLGAAYDRATIALSQYGAQRTAADAIISRRPDATALSSRFEQMDAELGQSASAIPGRKDGQSALDEVADKAREIMTKAVDAIRSMFGRKATATAAPSASPSAAPVP